MESILGHTSLELRERFAREGLPAYRADQALGWLYQRGVADFAAMSNLGLELRETLAQRFCTHVLERERVEQARDGTRKLVLRTHDGGLVEAVIIPEETRRTLCVSSQLGCSLDCSFCATGRLGLGRNLTAAEIVDQWLHAIEVLRPDDERPTNIVFMGMGEPLLNFKNVVQAVRVLTDAKGIGLSTRRITVSTAGVVPRIAALGEAVKVRLAISLHAATDAVRDTLVPLNRRFPIAELLEACRKFPLTARDRISFEYTLIRGVNDAPEDARRLVTLLAPLPSKLNLIPMNEHPGSPQHRRPDDVRIERFVREIARSPLPVSLRRSRGDDIHAACGQLGALAPAIRPKDERRAADT
jgi:23S rRNA (adenine2503-C2)-methyltransferase